jgi:hypothetical protein
VSSLRSSMIFCGWVMLFKTVLATGEKVRWEYRASHTHKNWAAC